MYCLQPWHIYGCFHHSLCNVLSWKHNRYTCERRSIHVHCLSAWLQFGRIDGCLCHLCGRLLRVKWSMHVANVCSGHRYCCSHSSDWLHGLWRRHVSRGVAVRCLPTSIRR